MDSECPAVSRIAGKSAAFFNSGETFLFTSTFMPTAIQWLDTPNWRMSHRLARVGVCCHVGGQQPPSAGLSYHLASGYGQ